MYTKTKKCVSIFYFLSLIYLIVFPIVAHCNGTQVDISNHIMFPLFILYFFIVFIFIYYWKSVKEEIWLLSDFINKYKQNKLYRSSQRINNLILEHIGDAEGSKTRICEKLIRDIDTIITKLHKDSQLVEPKLYDLYSKIEHASLRIVLLYFTVRHLLGHLISNMDICEVSTDNQKIIDDFKACIEQEQYVTIDVTKIEDSKLIEIIRMFQDNIHELSKYVKKTEYIDIDTRIDKIFSEFMQVQNSMKEIKPYMANIFNQIQEIKSLIKHQ